MAQLTTTALRNPVFVAKIRQAMRLAKTLSLCNPRGFGKAYVSNRKGNAELRVDWLPEGRYRVWGDLSQDVTLKVLSVVLQQSSRGLQA